MSYIYFPPTFLKVQFPHFNPRKCVTNATSIVNYNMTRRQESVSDMRQMMRPPKNVIK